ncbi:MAG: TSUP family transporter [Candidatus Sericytochromatia bacterium]
MDLKSYLLLIIVLFATITESVAGFGKTVISVTLGTNFYPIEFLLPVLVPLNLILSSYIVIRYYKYTDKNFLLKEILPFMLSGLIFGIFIFGFVKGLILKKIYGLLVLFLSIKELRILFSKQTENTKNFSKKEFNIWLLLSGIIQGIYASGGPLLVYALSSKKITKEFMRTNLAIIWLIMNSILLTNYIITNKINYETIKLSLLVLPVIPVGILIGDILHHKIDEQLFKKVVYSLLCVAGTIILF